MVSRLCIEHSANGWYQFATVIFFAFVTLLLIIDIIIQTLSNFNTGIIFQIEILIISIIIIFYFINQRTQKFIIQNIDNKVVSVVYGVEDEKELSFSRLSLKGEINFPKDGIVLTSSNSASKLPKTKIELAGRLYQEYTNFGFTEAWDDTIKWDNKIIKFSNWIVQEEYCCTYSTNDIKTQKERIRQKMKSRK